LALSDTEALQDGANVYQNDFVEYGELLYQWLLRKPLEDCNRSIDRLQIIPDAELNYIPFELLLTQPADTTKVNYKKLPYLLRDKSIGYLYTATFLKDKKEKNLENLLPLAGFSADYTKANYTALPFAEESVLNITKKVRGTAFANATKTQFITDGGKYKTLFFATHTEIDDKSPMNSALVFTPTTDIADYKLRAADLYNTTLNADMALLNACETGVGKINKGEGVMSLARAFTYAGCPSLVMSLWKIPDSSTPKITDTFFDYLQTGITKDKALQQAKLAYLDNTPERLSHPVYWGGLVATGDLSPIDFNTSSNGYVYRILAVLLGLVFILPFIYKKLK